MNPIKPFVHAAAAMLLTGWLATGCHSGQNDEQAEQTSAERILTIDTAKVTGWKVSPTAGDGYMVVKQDGRWHVALYNGQVVDADTAYINRSLRQMADLAATQTLNAGKDKWATYGLADSGTWVSIYRQGSDTARLMVGKMDFLNTNKTHFYVRIPGQDDAVYVVQNYLTGSFAAPLDKIRSKVVVPLMRSNMGTIDMITASGQKNTLNLKSGHPTINDDRARMASVTSYMGMLSALQMTSFTERPGTGANYSVIVTPRNTGETVSLKIYKASDTVYVLESSANNGNYMPLNPMQFSRIFPDKSFFAPPKPGERRQPRHMPGRHR